MTGYVRVDTSNNIADGNVISASDLDNEFDGVQAGFNASTGHTHGGSAGEGAPITKLGPTQDVTASASLLAPKITNTVDVGSSLLKFKDLWLDGNASVAGTTTLSSALTYGGVTLNNAVTGTGDMVLSTSPTLVTPALGTPASGTVTNLTGTASININGTVGATTANTGAFTTLTTSSTVTHNGGTANGVTYLNGSKVLTSGSALTFDGTIFGVGSGSTSGYGVLQVRGGFAYVNEDGANTHQLYLRSLYGSAGPAIQVGGADPLLFVLNSAEQMRLTSTGLGIGTSSPVAKLDVAKTSSDTISRTNASGVFGDFQSLGAGLLMQQTLSSPYGFALQAANAANSAQFPLLLNPSGGNVGIGTSSPQALFQVRGATNTPIVVSSNLINGAFSQIVLNHGSTYFGASDRAYQLFSQTNGSSARFGVQYWNGSTYSENLTLDASGNLGLGVTPSAWSSGKAFEVGFLGNGIWGNGANSLYTTANAYFNGGWKYAATGTATATQQSGGVHYWFTAPSGTAGAAITFTQAMTLDASGNLGIGTTSPTAIGGYTSLKVNNASSGAIIDLAQGDVMRGRLVGVGGAFTLETSGSIPILFAPGGTERARIDSSGNLLVGTTSNAIGGFAETRIKIQTEATRNGIGIDNISQDFIGLLTKPSGAHTYFAGYFVNSSNTKVGSIDVSTTATAYTTSSDYRLKENIQPMSGALEKIAAIKPCTYNWKSNGSDGQGFIAHELAEVVPDAVFGEKDAVDEKGNPKYQGIDVSFLVATLTAAIQEQQALIQSLQADVAALKAAA